MIKNFEYFLMIVEEGSLSKAAEKLYVSQPALSKYLKRLEDETGIELFNHSRSPLSLTYAGEQYLKYISEVDRLDKQMIKELSELKTNKRGRLKIGLALWRSSCILPEILPIFNTRYPDIELTLMEGNSEYLVSNLLKNRMDVCIMNPIATLDYSNLDYEIIMEEKIYLAANRNHHLVSRYSHDTVSDPPYFDVRLIENERLFLTKPGQNLTRILSSMFSKNRMSPAKVLETANLTTAINLVSAGLGFTFIPEAGTKSDLLPPNIMLFTIDQPALTWPLAVFFKKGAYITPTCQNFINTLKEVYAIPSSR
ncbi:LysR family transcriptional regulator [Enterocloster sp. OA13]|uniref:LysR family transcriptional regulator n=1 Tax=Enterocloster sp. OA13 TaxID=2914161 RepID=UPI0004723B5C|nr:LysR family transcriptional regulator [Enterocloster sp. OA13]